MDRGGMLTVLPGGEMAQPFIPSNNMQSTNTVPMTSSFQNNAQQPGKTGNYQIRQQLMTNQGMLFDGKRMRKSVHRKVVDYNSSVFFYIKNRIWQRDHRDFHAIQPDSLYQIKLVPPTSMLNNPMNCVTTKFVRQSTNKFRCPIFVLTWTPEGRRLVTGASSGEFTLWNGLSFNFETILQAHDVSVRAMQWSHNDQWMVTADHAGFIKYWQTNMNNVNMYQGHKEAVRGISFCPSDSKFTTCSDDGTLRVWDFVRCHEERILRGHGSDVKCVDWHPQKTLIASGSKDNQQPLKLWDPRTGNSLATIHAHKNTVMSLQWNKNGNWLLSASRDHLLKVFDIRNMKEEIQVFKGHKKEATAVAWHPIHEGLFSSGGSDGSIMFWMVGCDREVGSMEEAHEGMVWSLAWHPSGHILASGSNDHSTKFWTRNRPGDKMRDRYNLNNLPSGIEQELLEFDLEPNTFPNLPGMGLEHGLPEHLKPKAEIEDTLPAIPGLDWCSDAEIFKEMEAANAPKKKVPYARPIPKSFEQAWAGKIPMTVDERNSEQITQNMGANAMFNIGQERNDVDENSKMYRNQDPQVNRYADDRGRRQGPGNKGNIPSLMDESNMIRRPEGILGNVGNSRVSRNNINNYGFAGMGDSANNMNNPHSNTTDPQAKIRAVIEKQKFLDDKFEGGKFQPSSRPGHVLNEDRGHWQTDNKVNSINTNLERQNPSVPYGGQSDQDYRSISDHDYRTQWRDSGDNRSQNRGSNVGEFGMVEDVDFRHDGQKDYFCRDNRQNTGDSDYRQQKRDWDNSSQGEEWRNEGVGFRDAKRGGFQYSGEGHRRGSYSGLVSDNQRRGEDMSDLGTGSLRKRPFDNSPGNNYGEMRHPGHSDPRFSRGSGSWNNNPGNFNNPNQDFSFKRGKGSPRVRGAGVGRRGRGLGGNRGYYGGHKRM